MGWVYVWVGPYDIMATDMNPGRYYMHQGWVWLTEDKERRWLGLTQEERARIREQVRRDQERRGDREPQ